MATLKKKQIDELVGGDPFSNGNDRNKVNNSEIETGPMEKPFNDDSYYEKGVSTTTDKVFGRYRQNIPWFAVYSFGGSRTGGITINYGLNESKTVLKKKNVEEVIEDLVKKSNYSDVNPKDYNPDVQKVLDKINDLELTKTQIEDLIKILNGKMNNPKKIKNL